MNKLDQFEALERAATAAPWTANDLWLHGPAADVAADFIVNPDPSEDGTGGFDLAEDCALAAAARNLAPAFLYLARTVQTCLEKIGYLENLTDTEAYAKRQLRAALAPLLAEVPNADA